MKHPAQTYVKLEDKFIRQETNCAGANSFLALTSTHLYLILHFEFTQLTFSYGILGKNWYR